MAIPIVRPESKHVSFPEGASKACVECAHCKVSKSKKGGACVHPDNTQDANGVVPEVLDDIYSTEGFCKGFSFRALRGEVQYA